MPHESSVNSCLEECEECEKDLNQKLLELGIARKAIMFYVSVPDKDCLEKE